MNIKISKVKSVVWVGGGGEEGGGGVVGWMMYPYPVFL